MMVAMLAKAGHRGANAKPAQLAGFFVNFEWGNPNVAFQNLETSRVFIQYSFPFLRSFSQCGQEVLR
jgi:hypothetical protein